MNLRTSLISFGLLVTLMLTLSACSGNDLLTQDAIRISRAAAGIIEFEPPAGYEPELSTSLFGYTLVMFAPPDENNCHLYLIQSEKETDREQLERMMSQMVPGLRDRNSRMTVLETSTITLRGQEETLVISQAANSEGSIYRQAMVSFQGKAGPALLVFSEPASRWSVKTLDRLLGSIQ